MTQELLEKTNQLQKDIDRAYDLKWLFDNMDCDKTMFIRSVSLPNETVNTAFPDYKLCRCVSEAIEKYISKKEEEFENLK